MDSQSFNPVVLNFESPETQLAKQAMMDSLFKREPGPVRALTPASINWDALPEIESHLESPLND